jgi:hypothetical protein
MFSHYFSKTIITDKIDVLSGAAIQKSFSPAWLLRKIEGKKFKNKETQLRQGYAVVRGRWKKGMDTGNPFIWFDEGLNMRVKCMSNDAHRF